MLDRMKTVVVLTAMATGLPAIAGIVPAWAEVDRPLEVRLVEADISPMDLNRAKNYARQAAEDANGGLGEYRAEPSMHGPSADSPHVINSDGTITFTFRGRAPEAETYTVESVVTVDLTTWAVNIDYNGPIR
ncbi:MAG: hypothetical protein J7642_15630 [Cyanobacteria bacterium SBC]|nr:hypothetical protein [Cyanobacteria bacterium SBC]